MQQALGGIASLVVTILVARFLLKRYQAHIVLLVAGLVLMAVAVLLGATSPAILGKAKSTGFIGFDIFKFIQRTMSARVAGLGLIIMSAAGFAKYMDYTGASKIMVFTVIKPLKKLQAPYVMLTLTFIVGAMLKMVIPSAAGLALLLMVTIYPIIVALGASHYAAAAMVVTCGCFDLGPASGNANLAAQNAGMDITAYFVQYQIAVGVVGYITTAVLHYFSAKYYDKRDKVGAIYGDAVEAAVSEETRKKAEGGPMPPQYYMILPALPLILLLVFSDLGIKGVKLDVVTAMFICFVLTLLIECLRNPKGVKEAFKGSMIFFQTMGNMFGSVISLIVAGETFAQGLTATGAVDLLVSTAQNAGFGPAAMTATMTLFISIACVVMGSGNAPFFAFAALAPRISAQLGFPAVYMLLPMQMASGIARVLSPITAVVVAVGGMSNISPFDLVRRLFIPAGGALITTTIAALVLY